MMLRPGKLGYCLTCAAMIATQPSATAANEWTVMIYGGVDSSAEDHIMSHLSSLRHTTRRGQSGEVILLIDRAAGHSENVDVFGENFEDTRLYRLRPGKWERIGGGSEFPEITDTSVHEANTADAETLGKFIRACKTQFPAEHYMLMIFGHGHCRAVCPDDSTQGDSLFTAEITEAISEAEAVDLIWFDVCSFGGIENAYQLRPGTGRFHAKYMVATPPVSSPAPMRNILKQAGIIGARKEDQPLPKSGAEFGTIVVRATERSLRGGVSMDPSLQKECWGCYDLGAADDVKKAMDQLAVMLASSNAKGVVEQIRGKGDQPATMNYLHPGDRSPWLKGPHFDLYDFARRLSASVDLGSPVRAKARELMRAVDRLVVTSVGMQRYVGFEDGRNGLFIVFPDGDATENGERHWAKFRWYHPFDQREASGAFGKYAWCRDGATPDNGRVENWFELLDHWYDDPAAAPGGLNGYTP